MNKKRHLSKQVRFNYKAFAWIFIIDALFFLIFGIIAFQLLNSVAQDSIFVSNMLQEKTNEMLQTGQLGTRDDVFNLLASNQEFIKAYGNVFTNVVLTIIMFVVLYIIFQSVSWWLCDRKRLRFWSYFYRFGLINLVWFFVFFIILFVYLNAISNIDSLFIPGILRVSYMVLLIASISLLSYFLILCYCYIKEKTFRETIKKSFIVGVAKFNSIFWKFLLLGVGKVLSFILVFIIAGFFNSILLGMILFLLIVVSYIAWAKLRIIRVLDRV